MERERERERESRDPQKPHLSIGPPDSDTETFVG